MLWRALSDRDIRNASLWSSRRQPQLQPKQPEREGGSRAFPHFFFFFVLFFFFLSWSSSLGNTDVEYCQDSFYTLPSWLTGVLKLWAWRCQYEPALEMVIFVHFALWFWFLIWETDLIKQVRFVIYLSRALMSYSCFIWVSNRSSEWENSFGTSIKEPHCSFSALMFEVTNSFAIRRCKHHILLNTHVNIWHIYQSSVFTAD